MAIAEIHIQRLKPSIVYLASDLFNQKAYLQGHIITTYVNRNKTHEHHTSLAMYQSNA